MSRIDILIQSSRYYSFESYASRCALKALKSLHQDARIICLESYGVSKYLREAGSNPSKWCLQFEDLFPGEHLLCEATGIPSLLWSWGNAATTVFYAFSHAAQVAYIDQSYAKPFGYLFLPPAVDDALMEGREETTLFDTVLFADAATFKSLQGLWHDLFDPDQVEGIKCTVRKAQEKAHLPLLSVAKTVHESVKISLHDLVFCAEEWLQAEKTARLIACFQSSALDVFGEHKGNGLWKGLKNREWIRLHSLLPYTEHFSVLKRSRIMIGKPSHSQTLCDPWFFAAAACGCLPLSAGTSYLQGILGSECPLFFTMESVQEKVQYFLDHPRERLGWVDYLRNHIVPKMSWRSRMKKILHEENRFFSGR